MDAQPLLHLFILKNLYIQATGKASESTVAPQSTLTEAMKEVMPKENQITEGRGGCFFNTMLSKKGIGNYEKSFSLASREETSPELTKNCHNHLAGKT